LSKIYREKVQVSKNKNLTIPIKKLLKKQLLFFFSKTALEQQQCSSFLLILSAYSPSNREKYLFKFYHVYHEFEQALLDCLSLPPPKGGDESEHTQVELV